MSPLTHHAERMRTETGQFLGKALRLMRDPRKTYKTLIERQPAPAPMNPIAKLPLPEPVEAPTRPARAAQAIKVAGLLAIVGILAASIASA
jgi:hypothetical protein